MAKIVIAGRADCPYFAKVERLADSLVKNLSDFSLNKIVKTVEEWEDWLSETCKERGWEHKKSPLVWRELVDRGGKGVLIGGANEFQEYVKGYYGIQSNFTSDDMTKIATENLQTKIEIDEELRQFKALSNPIKVCVTSASSPSCYNMVHAIAKGDVLGPDTEVSMCLLGQNDQLDTLNGLQMEAFDLGCHLLRKINVTTNTSEAFRDCSAIIILDEIEKTEEESKEEWLKRNHDYFVEYAKIINTVAKKDVRVVIAGNGPVNFNASMMIKNAPDIPRQNIVASSRMVENHAKALIAERLKVNSAGVVDIVIWGNANGSHFVDVTEGRVHGYDGAIWGPPSYSVPVGEMVHDDKWLEGEYLEALEKRREMVEGALQHPKSMSHAASAASLLAHWWGGAPDGQIFSLGVYSEGLYGIPEGMVFSLPVSFSLPGYWSVVQDKSLTDENKEKLGNIIKELQSEEHVIYPPPREPTPDPPPQPDTHNEQDPNVNNSAQEGQKDKDHESDSESASPILAKIKEDPVGEARAEMERQGAGSRASTESGRGSQAASTRPPSQASQHE